MLVINRKSKESIVINGNIEILISEIDGDRVKLCINAPSEVPIFRKELLETKDINAQAVHNLSNASFTEFKSLAEEIKKGGK